MATSISAAQPQSIIQEALERHFQRKEEIGRRIIVRIVKCSLRFSDKTNLYAGYKLLEDQLRYCALIPNDDPETIEIEISQIKVAHRHETGTYLEIVYPE